MIKNKRNLGLVLTLSLIVSSTGAVSASTINLIEGNSQNNNIMKIIDEIEYKVSPENPNIKTCEVVDEKGINHFISINYETMEMSIDNEKVHFEYEEIRNDRATIDSSSAAKITSKIPWKGSVILLSAAIAGLISGGTAAGWAATIAGAITADAENIYVSFTQYKSKEKYWSSHTNTYYNKYINKNIIFRQTSSTGKILCGPVNGSWFDPVRPAY